MRRSRTKEELVMAARNLGWTGTRGSMDKTQLITWLAEKGMPLHRIPTLAEATRKLAAGSNLNVGSVAPDVVASLQAKIATLTTLVQGASAASSGVAASAADIKAAVKAALDSQRGTDKIVFNDGFKPVVLKEHTHPMFEKVLRLVKAGLNVLLVGPAGCGKTTLAEQVAKALNRDYGALHCTAGASESQLTGWLLPVGDKGTFSYVPSEFVNLYEKGDSVFLVDEIDASDPNMLLVINSALANGSLHVPQRYKKPHIARGKNAAIIAAANTFGSGADIIYAGRNQLDGATLDRFYVVVMDYDAGLEAKIMDAPAPDTDKWVAAEKPTEADIAELNTWVGELRCKVAQHWLRRVVSTRTFMKAVAARRAGISSAEIKRDVLAGWTRDELVKIGAV